jgi:hypothetical protein
MLVAFIMMCILAITSYYILKKNEYVLKKNEQWSKTYYKSIKIAIESEKDSVKRKELIEKFKK